MDDETQNGISKIIDLHKIQLAIRQNYEKGELYKNLELYQRLIMLKNKLNNVGGALRALCDYDKLCFQLQKRDEALKVHQEIIKLLNQTKSRLLKEEVFNELNKFYQEIGENDLLKDLNQNLKAN